MHLDFTPATARPRRSALSLMRRARRGFALIITLSMMTLLLLLVLTLTTLVRIHMLTATSNLVAAQARQNALLAAYIGIGQLQKFAGPDQRVTATATLGLGGQNAIVGNSDQTLALTPKRDQIYGGQGGQGDDGIPKTQTLLTQPYTTGGTWYWTSVWGPGVNPLALYTGVGAAYNGSTAKGPDPILLNWLVSGDEGTPLTGNFLQNGVVAPPPGQGGAVAYTPDTGDAQTGIGSTSQPSSYNWSALTNDITITPKTPPPGVKGPQPAALLVGPNTAYTSSQSSYTVSSAQGTQIYTYPHDINTIVAPIVTINDTTPTGTANFTSGRYAFWVGDEGVKAKYTPVDPYTGNITANTSGDSGQFSRYRFWAPLRSGIERMLSFSTYGNFNGATTSSFSPTLAAKLGQMIEPSQIYFIDSNLKGAGPTGAGGNRTNPEQTLQTNYFDFTTTSYGVIADSLRGGLRYDLTTAFQEPSKGTQSTAFKDSTNGLANRSILPGANTATAAAITATTEPNVVAVGGHGVALSDPIGPGPTGNNTFHGPNAPPPPGAPGGTWGGLRWDAIENYYNIAANNTSGAAVPVQAASTIKAGITPLITQFRLRFGQFADSSEEQYVSIEPEFVLANPYSFPITDAGGGMDLGFRINTSTIPPGYSTGWEWFAGLNGRNDVRQAPTNNGESIAIGYDTTQTVGLGGVASNASGFGINFRSSSGGSNSVTPGYYAWLKNPVNYPSAVSNGYASVLDNVAFHIPHQDKQTGAILTFAPGEAKVISLSSFGCITRQVSSIYNAPQGQVVGVIGTPLTGSQLGGSAIAPGSIAVVLMTATQPLFSPSTNLPSPYYFLRDTGINTGKYVLIQPSNAVDPGGQGANGSWPAKEYGYISTMDPSVAFTLELRSDQTEPIPNSGSTNTVPQPYSISGSNFTVSKGVAGPGQNVLQAITNMDLTGAGMMAGNKVSQPDPRGYVPPFSMANAGGYRRQFLGTKEGGSMPIFLSSYLHMISLPGNLGDGPTTNSGNQTDMVGFYVDNSATTAKTPEGWFDPSQYLGYRVYTDFNLRSANMALPPFASFNSPWAGNATTPTTGALTNNINAYMTVPPYGRVFDEGPGDDDSQITGQEDNTFSQNALGKSPNNQGFVSNPDDVAWGYSNSVRGGGQQFVALYSLPVKGASNGLTVGSPPITVPDVPMISLGQLTHADFTQDDIWASVGYQPGNAFGNSYFTPYVSRGSSVQAHPNVSATKVMLTEAPATWVGGGTSSSPFTLPATVNAYDISYLTNVALWDRYFFSSLVPAVSNYPANSRLVFAAGYSAAAAVANMQTGTNPTDPATNKPTFVAYTPARFMMIDGAFNVNSTSFEAWRAVLSALRGVNFSNGAGNKGGQTVAYFPRTMASGNLSTQTSNGSKVNIPVDDSSATAGNKDPASYAGFRQLTDDQIDLLAAKIVEQVHQRGPFLSLAQFVNRSLQYTYTGGTGSDDLFYTVSGPLQAAIDMSTNVGFPSFNHFSTQIPADTTTGLFRPGNPASNTTGGTTAIYPDAPLYGPGSNPYAPFNAAGASANPYSVITGIPGWLTQADLLEVLAPILSARSDTFTIRSYGEVLNPAINQANLLLSPSDSRNPITSDPSAVQSRAWCEVVVQRMPDYIATDPKSMNDPSTTNGYGAPNPSGKNTLSAVNAYFGRRFRIISIKYLNADDI